MSTDRAARAGVRALLDGGEHVLAGLEPEQLVALAERIEAERCRRGWLTHILGKPTAQSPLGGALCGASDDDEVRFCHGGRAVATCTRCLQLDGRCERCGYYHGDEDSCIRSSERCGEQQGYPGVQCSRPRGHSGTHSHAFSHAFGAPGRGQGGPAIAQAVRAAIAAAVRSCGERGPWSAPLEHLGLDGGCRREAGHAGPHQAEFIGMPGTGSAERRPETPRSDAAEGTT